MEEKKGLDIILVVAVLFLLGLGVTMVYSASSVMAPERFSVTEYYFLIKQGKSIGLGLLIMLLVMGFNYNHYRKLAYPIFFATLGVLVVVLMVGSGDNGSHIMRWLKIGGFRFQPSEAAKVAIVMYLAHSLTKKKEKIKEFSVGFLPHVILTVIMMGLILVQPDLGSVIIIAAIMMIMLFTAGVRFRYLFVLVGLCAPIVWHLIVSSPYRLARWKAFWDPDSDPFGAGYHIIQSKLAFGSGGLAGLGWGNGKQKLFYLPEAHTDFILSVIGEELGFLGVSLIFFMFIIIVYRGIKISMEAENMFGSLLALGLTTLIGLQAVVNSAVVMGVVPTKGLVLPFISYGGTSMVMSLFAVGVLLNISSRRET